MTSIELLKEIQSWLSFNTEPSKEETAKLRKSIKEHLTEQLHIHDVVGRSEQLTAFAEYCDEEHGLFIPSWMIDGYNKSR
ncbi:hypothetical protein M8845_19310 [Gelidibacter japonicus]|uniref:hypothetical protein n=1 Tax=Gelidibacter japonicus TaxID=1962232 RepID=UPI002020E037|nr:hypothetical protein [Gelidibacter japonicus]MCL8009575.1 hypothetical protein [Gelidibacter japonicus]